MGKTALLDIQKGIYDKLTGDATLMALITGVFDEVPKDQEFPYVAIGTATEVKFNTFDKQGRDVTEEIYAYSQYDGFKECLQVMERIAELLDYQVITLASNSLVYIRYDDGDTSLSTIDEGRTKQARGRFRIIVQEP